MELYDNIIIKEREISVKDWFEKATSGKMNNTILFIIHRGRVEWLIKKIEDSLGKSVKIFTARKMKYNIEYIKNFNSDILVLNSIVFGFYSVDLRLFIDCKNRILCCDEFTFEKIIDDSFNEDKKGNTQKLGDYENHNLIYKRDPIWILGKKDKSFIYTYMFSIIYRKIPTLWRKEVIYFRNLQIIQNKNSTISDDDEFLQILKYDLQILNESQILTARLAVEIYKVFTLRFNDSATKIGRFFRENLGIKSKVMRLRYEDNFRLMQCDGVPYLREEVEILKVYDLKNSPRLNEIK